MNTRNKKQLKTTTTISMISILGLATITACSDETTVTAASPTTTSASANSTISTPTPAATTPTETTPPITAKRNFKEAVALPKRKRNTLKKPVPATKNKYVTPAKLLANGDVLWETARQEQSLQLWNPDLLIHTKNGATRTISRGKKQGTQRQTSAFAADGTTIAWRSTTSTHVADTDWHITTQQGNKPPVVVATMSEADKRPGERSGMAPDQGANLAIHNQYVVWTDTVPEEDSEETDTTTKKVQGLEWWFAPHQNPKKISKVVVNAAFPATHKGALYGFGHASPNPKGPADTLLRVDLETGKVEKVLTLKLGEKETPSSFCASDTHFAIGTGIDVKPFDDDTDNHSSRAHHKDPGRVIVFDETGEKDSLATQYEVSDVTCGDNLVGITTNDGEQGEQYLFDLKGKGKILKLDAGGGFAAVQTTKRHVMWAMPDPKNPDRAQYIVARDL